MTTKDIDKTSGIASDSLEHGYERTDAKGLPLIGFIVFLLIGTSLTMVFTGWMLGEFKDRRAEVDLRPHKLAEKRQTPPAPRLQERPDLEYDKYELNQRLLTETYSFIDRESGAVLLPIDRAMELVLEEGIQRFELPEDPEGSTEGGAK